MMRIPFWISRPVLSAFGPSPSAGRVRFAFYAAVLSRISPLLRGTAGSGARGRARAATARPAGRAGGAAARPSRRGEGRQPGARRPPPGQPGPGRTRRVQPPLPGMPLGPPRRPRHQPARPVRPAPVIAGSRPSPPPDWPPPPGQPPGAAGTGTGSCRCPGMPARPPRPRQLPLPPSARRPGASPAPRTQPPEGSPLMVTGDVTRSRPRSPLTSRCPTRSWPG